MQTQIYKTISKSRASSICFPSLSPRSWISDVRQTSEHFRRVIEFVRMDVCVPHVIFFIFSICVCARSCLQHVLQLSTKYIFSRLTHIYSLKLFFHVDFLFHFEILFKICAPCSCIIPLFMCHVMRVDTTIYMNVILFRVFRRDFRLSTEHPIHIGLFIFYSCDWITYVHFTRISYMYRINCFKV